MLYNANVDRVGRQARRQKIVSDSSEGRQREPKRTIDYQLTGKDVALVKKQKYVDTLPREMYKFFSEFSNDSGAPSFEKFAILKGMTLEELNSYRSRKNFDRAYRECCEIRRDYLIDRALTKRFDPSFVKFLLTECDDTNDDTLTLKLEVVEG